MYYNSHTSVLGRLSNCGYLWGARYLAVFSLNRFFNAGARKLLDQEEAGGVFATVEDDLLQQPARPHHGRQELSRPGGRHRSQSRR